MMINQDKWEKTTITRGTKEEEKEWRNTKKLGSLLGDYEDMKRRMIQSNIAIESVEKIRPKKRISIEKKLKIYKAMVKSVLTHNMSTWGLTKSQTDELERFHRKQLRQIQNDKRKPFN